MEQQVIITLICSYQPKGVSPGCRLTGANALRLMFSKAFEGSPAISKSKLDGTLKRRSDRQKCPSYALVRGDSVRHRGFTLMEVMLACVLGSMLSVVVIQLMKTTLMETRRIATSRQPMGETWLLRELIASDIGNTRAYRISRDTMVLGGFLTTDLETGAKTQQLSLVTYQLVRHGDRMALERSELPFHSQQSQPRKEIIWYGVGSIVAFPQAEYLESISSTIPELRQLGLQSLSGGMIVRIFDSDNKLLLEVQ